MRRLKILHAYQSPSYSGAEAYAHELAQHHAKNHDVTFLVKPLSDLEKKIAESPAIQCVNSNSGFDITTFDVVILHSTQELKKLWYKLATAKLRKLLGGRAPRVVVYTHIWISHSKIDPLHAITYSIVDRFWCGSEQSRSVLKRFLPLRNEKIEVVRYGRATTDFANKLLPKSESRKKLEIPEDAIVVGTMARVDKGKGSRELLDAVTDLMQSRRDLHLLMIGPPTASDPKATELDQELERDIQSMNPAIRSRIHKIGRLDGGSYYLRAFDIFILATYKENFALTLLEAMLAGVPCLATDSGGSPDVIRPHSTGWLFYPESAESLRSTLLSALEQKEKWPVFGENGRRLVINEYDFETVMRELDARLQKLAD